MKMRTGTAYKIIGLISLGALMFTGCSGSSQKAEFYTLNSISSTQPSGRIATAAQPVSIGIG
ncbi:MAG: hypothetical protein PVI58_09225, partial [Desulfobacterales bacterium]